MIPFLTRKEAAALLGISTAKVRELEKTPWIDAQRLGHRTVRIDPESKAFMGKSAGGASEPLSVPSIPSAPTITPAGSQRPVDAYAGTSGEDMEA